MSVDSLIIKPWCKTMTEVYNKIKHVVAITSVVVAMVKVSAGFSASFDVSMREFRLSNNINARSGGGVGDAKKKVATHWQRS